MGRPKKKKVGRPAKAEKKKVKKKAVKKTKKKVARAKSPKKWDIPDLVTGRFVIRAEDVFLCEGSTPGTDSFTDNFREAYVFVSKERSEEIRLSRSEDGQVLNSIPSESVALKELASNTYDVEIEPKDLSVTIKVNLVGKGTGVTFKQATTAALKGYHEEIELLEKEAVQIAKKFEKDLKENQRNLTRAGKNLETIQKRLLRYG